jgi:hypothetical protein
MNTIQLSLAMSQNKVTKKTFQGVFPSDGLPKNIIKPATVIANTDPSSKPGKHWVAFYFPKRGNAEYFDSSGQFPCNKKFVNFLKKNSASFKFNKKRLQGSFSSTCGHYCAVYLLSRSKGKTMKEFLSKFSETDLISNDLNIARLFETNFHIPQYGGGDGKKYIVFNQTCKPIK